MLNLNFNPFPELNTERLFLRKINKNDAAEIFFLRSDPDVLQYIGREPAQSIQDADDFISQINHGIDANEIIMWGIAMQDEPNQLIGTICFWQIRKEHYRAETGFVLHPLYWRKGIMKEALHKVIDYGFNVMQLHSIDANVAAGNDASALLLESTGFVREAYFKEDFFFNGKFYDTIVYSRLQNEQNGYPGS